MNEQFIQDAISKHSRLLRVLHQLGYTDWRSEDSDVLNQEFNFRATDHLGRWSGGRVDVVATFNGKTRLVLIEVKVVASPEDMKQLSWYVDHCSAIGEQAMGGPQPVDLNNTIGILLASEFGPGRYERGDRPIRRVRFHFDGSTFPFEESLSERDDEPTPIVVKVSRLVKIGDHTQDLPPDVLATFDEMRQLCLEVNDPRLAWVVENPKSGHVAIHYKGEYIAWFFFRTKWFEIGYALPGSTSLTIGKGDDPQKALEKARIDFQQILERIDKQAEGYRIPHNFTWADFDSDRSASCD